MARLRAPAAICALAAAIWLAFGRGFANYDSLYSLVWGRQIAHGHAPSFDVSLAPTPHPLANLLGAVLTPLGATTGETVLVVIAYLALGAVGWLIYALGREWFGTAAGVLAAAIFLTREPVLSYGVRAYVDLPYLALVLGALLVEARRSRAGAPVLVLLGLAGLIRPEAWLFAAAYVAWTRRWDLVWLAAAGPLLWVASDLLLTGDPLHSLTGTRENTRTLGRVTGLQHVPATLPRRIGEVLREPVLVGAAGGGVLALWLLRERARLAAAAGILAVLAFCVLAAAGLPIITRYTFAADAILAVFCGAGVFGWQALRRDHPRRLAWMAFGAVAVALLVAFVPSQVRRLRSTHDAIVAQHAIRDDLYALLRTPLLDRRPPPIGVVNHRLVPSIALVRDLDPAQVLAAPLPRDRIVPSAIWPANAHVARVFVLDPRDPSRRVPKPPRGDAPIAVNPSWRLLAPASVFHGGE